MVCRMLGFAKDANNVATTRSKYGRVPMHFIMAEVNCNGTESNIGLCAYNATESCGSSERAGVMCGIPEEGKSIRYYKSNCML